MKTRLIFLLVAGFLLCGGMLVAQEEKEQPFSPKTNISQLLEDQTVPSEVRNVLRDSVVSIAFVTEEGADSVDPNLKIHINGMGFAVAEGGYVVTNVHVVQLRVYNRQGELFRIIALQKLFVLSDGEYLTADVVSVDYNSDLALLRIEDKDVKRFRKKPIRFNVARILSDPNWPMFAYGFVTDTLMIIDEFRHFNGYISDLTLTAREVSRFWGLQKAEVDIGYLDRPLAPGFSGGPVIDRSGNCRGVLFEYQELRAAFIPASSVVKFLKKNLPPQSVLLLKETPAQEAQSTK